MARLSENVQGQNTTMGCNASRLSGTKSNNPEGIVTNREIGKLNRNIVLLVDEIIEREKFRIKYPWKVTGLWVYIYKSLPIKIIYNEILEKLPGFHKSIVKEANETLADIREDRLVLAILDVAKNKGISQDKIDKISTLIRFLDGVYSDVGLGEGFTEYHNFHHSLEVSYMTLKMLPNTINNYRFSADDIEILLVVLYYMITIHSNSLIMAIVRSLKIMVTLNKDPIFVHQ